MSDTSGFRNGGCISVIMIEIANICVNILLAYQETKKKINKYYECPIGPGRVYAAVDLCVWAT